MSSAYKYPNCTQKRYHVVNDEDGNDRTGSSCIVEKIRLNINHDDTICVAKIISVNDKDEINILKLLGHENIVKVVDDCVDDNQKSDNTGDYMKQINTALVESPSYVAPELVKVLKDRILVSTADIRHLVIWNSKLLCTVTKYPWN
ncbi:234_t:CDS:2 [Entrophospora sp. SA101]|nr:234_t:CDS:2 [Entrophospora sp. SA101]